MIERPDPLWDPQQPGDVTLGHLASLLGRYRHVPPPERVWSAGSPAVPRRRARRGLLAAAVALAACLAGVAVWVPWRLHWEERRQWAVDADAGPAPASLGVGGTLTTRAGESATVRVARIGRMDVLPGTRIVSDVLRIDAPGLYSDRLLPIVILAMFEQNEEHAH